MHPEMLAYIFVGTTAYSAVVDRDGRFSIPDVPPGTWKIAIWNPRLKAAEQTVTLVQRCHGHRQVRPELSHRRNARGLALRRPLN